MILQWLDKDRFDGTRVRGSVRAATVTPELSSILAKRGSRSLTITIESGSEHARCGQLTASIHAAARLPNKAVYRA